MENKQAVAVAIGAAAVGTALAYLGYSAYQKKDKVVDEKESLYNEVDGVDDVQLKEAIKEETNVKISATKKNSAWGKFWSDTHKDMQKENEDN